jgi:hypothetical protein
MASWRSRVYKVVENDVAMTLASLRSERFLVFELTRGSCATWFDLVAEVQRHLRFDVAVRGHSEDAFLEQLIEAIELHTDSEKVALIWRDSTLMRVKSMSDYLRCEDVLESAASRVGESRDLRFPKTFVVIIV